MSLEWNLEFIKKGDEICWESTDDPEEAKKDAEWKQIEDDLFVRMNPKTHALILASEQIHLSNLSSNNMHEWKYRLDSLFDIDEYFLSVETNDGEAPLRIRFSDLKIHVGLKTNAHTWTKERFDKHIRELRMKRILSFRDTEI